MAAGDEIDQFYLVVEGMVVLFMQCGFAFLEAGAVRSKNVTNILIKNLFDCFVTGNANEQDLTQYLLGAEITVTVNISPQTNVISGITYWLIGYAFAFGEGNDFIGYHNFALHDVPENKYAFWFFQYTFAATAATIVSGAVAERCEFVAYFVYSIGITGFIYPVVTHWQWGEGFLFKGKDYGGDIGVVAYQDFAGSGLVHILGGMAAFCGALMLGPRIGRFDRETKQTVTIRGHSVPIAALGGFILFFGFLAFNGGSQLSIQNEGDGAAVSLSVVNTVISASCAAFSSLFINKMKVFGNQRWSLLISINGALTGMVSVCAGCNVVYTWGACVIGLVAGIVYSVWSLIVRKLKVDDPLDAVAVHFGGGTWGVIAVAFLARDTGIVFNWDAKSGLMLAWQFAGLAAIAVWTAALSLLLFGTLKLLRLLRVSEEIEMKGLDIAKHNEPAYPVEAYGHGHIEKIIQILENTPTQVTQAFEKLSTRNGTSNNAFVYEVQDKGPYESLEVKTHITSTPPGPNVNPAKSGPVPRIQVQRDERIRL